MLDADDPLLSDSDNIKRLAYLSLYQMVIYCDDSGSMEGKSWEDQSQLVERITRVSSKLLPPDMGVELRFVNQDLPSTLGKLSVDDVAAIYKKTKPAGDTPIGTSLEKKILKPLIYDLIDSDQFKRPLLVCTITDGCPNKERRDTFKNNIIQCKDILEDNDFDMSCAMFSVSRVGSDPDAIDFLKNLELSEELEDILYCTSDMHDTTHDLTLEKMRDNERSLEVWLVKMLTAPLLKED